LSGDFHLKELKKTEALPIVDCRLKRRVLPQKAECAGEKTLICERQADVGHHRAKVALVM
jgi:hypothetical protein